MADGDLEEVVSYGDLQYEIPVEEIVILGSVENVPDESLLSDVLHGNVIGDGTTIHFLDDGNSFRFPLSALPFFFRDLGGRATFFFFFFTIFASLKVYRT